MPILPTSGNSSGGSISSGQGASQSTSASQSRTEGTAATQAAINAATVAYERQKELNEAQMRFNAEEAAKQRAWEENMANTIYTRSVKNMKEAGLNPILAANMGLSGASVGSGATASMGGSSAPISQTFADSYSNSASEASSYNESHGSSWNQSMYGIQSTYQQAADTIKAIIDGVNSSQMFSNLVDAIKNIDTGNKTVNEAISNAQKTVDSVKDWITENKGKNNWQRKYQTKIKKPSNAH